MWFWRSSPHIYLIKRQSLYNIPLVSYNNVLYTCNTTQYSYIQLFVPSRNVIYSSLYQVLFIVLDLSTGQRNSEWCRQDIKQIFAKSLHEKIKDYKGVIRIRKSKDRQYYDQYKKDKRATSDLQNTTQKTKDWATWTSLKTGLNPCAPEGVSSFCSLVTLVVLLLNNTNIISNDDLFYYCWTVMISHGVVNV